MSKRARVRADNCYARATGDEAGKFKSAYRQSSFEQLLHLDYFVVVIVLLVFGGKETSLGATTPGYKGNLFIVLIPLFINSLLTL